MLLLRRSRRIIPARAGFTTDPQHADRPGADHPRSRGVYDHGRLRRGTMGGSSPLARGLRGGLRPDRLRHWAGRYLDHPRSRGVYAASSTRRACGRGSSPLARGLRSTAWGSSGRPWIIPARAGFTGCRPRRGDRRWDHPRSRGVYLSTRSWRCWCAGSSPLARGLPMTDAEQALAARIIPARAGFTRPGPCRSGR